MAGVLIADDEPDVRTLIRILLETGGDGHLTVVAEASDGAEALQVWRELPERPDAVVLDNRMPELSGLEVATLMLAEEPEQVIVLCTSILDGNTRRAAAAMGIGACIPKRDIDMLPATIRALLDARPEPPALRIVED